MTVIKFRTTFTKYVCLISAYKTSKMVKNLLFGLNWKNIHLTVIFRARDLFNSLEWRQKFKNDLEICYLDFSQEKVENGQKRDFTNSKVTENFEKNERMHNLK